MRPWISFAGDWSNDARVPVSADIVPMSHPLADPSVCSTTNRLLADQSVGTSCNDRRFPTGRSFSAPLMARSTNCSPVRNKRRSPSADQIGHEPPVKLNRNGEPRESRSQTSPLRANAIFWPSGERPNVPGAVIGPPLDGSGFPLLSNQSSSPLMGVPSQYASSPLADAETGGYPDPPA